MYLDPVPLGLVQPAESGSKSVFRHSPACYRMVPLNGSIVENGSEKQESADEEL